MDFGLCNFSRFDHTFLHTLTTQGSTWFIALAFSGISFLFYFVVLVVPPTLHPFYLPGVPQLSLHNKLP